MTTRQHSNSQQQQQRKRRLPSSVSSMTGSTILNIVKCFLISSIIIQPVTCQDGAISFTPCTSGELIDADSNNNGALDLDEYDNLLDELSPSDCNIAGAYTDGSLLENVWNVLTCLCPPDNTIYDTGDQLGLDLNLFDNCCDGQFKMIEGEVGTMQEIDRMNKVCGVFGRSVFVECTRLSRSNSPNTTNSNTNTQTMSPINTNDGENSGNPVDPLNNDNDNNEQQPSNSPTEEVSSATSESQQQNPSTSPSNYNSKEVGGTTSPNNDSSSSWSISINEQLDEMVINPPDIDDDEPSSKKWPIYCALVVAVVLSLLAGVYFWNMRKNKNEKQRQPSETQSDDIEMATCKENNSSDSHTSQDIDINATTKTPNSGAGDECKSRLNNGTSTRTLLTLEDHSDHHEDDDRKPPARQTAASTSRPPPITTITTRPRPPPTITPRPPPSATPHSRPPPTTAPHSRPPPSAIPHHRPPPSAAPHPRPPPSAIPHPRPPPSAIPHHRPPTSSIPHHRPPPTSAPRPRPPPTSAPRPRPPPTSAPRSRPPPATAPRSRPPPATAQVMRTASHDLSTTVATQESSNQAVSSSRAETLPPTEILWDESSLSSIEGTTKQSEMEKKSQKKTKTKNSSSSSSSSKPKKRSSKTKSKKVDEDPLDTDLPPLVTLSGHELKDNTSESPATTLVDDNAGLTCGASSTKKKKKKKKKKSNSEPEHDFDKDKFEDLAEKSDLYLSKRTLDFSDGYLTDGDDIYGDQTKFGESFHDTTVPVEVFEWGHFAEDLLKSK